jgi:hypothetical protein
MRLTSLALILTLGLSAAPLAAGSAQSAPDTTKTRKPPSKLAKIAKKVADSAATTAAGAGVQSLLGKQAGGVANALGAGGLNPCGAGYGVTAGAAIVGAAKGIAKKAADTSKAAAANPCVPGAGIPGMAAGIPGMPGGIPGMPAGADAAAAAAAMAGATAGGAAAAAAAGASPLGGMAGMGTMAKYTPVGLAASAAPGAIKGIKGMLGGKPQDKTVMLRELGKGSLELKVKLIEGTQEFEPGFEESFTTFAEAITLVEGTYYLYVSPEAPREKGAEPDTVLARKRVARVWGLMAAVGVSDQKVVAVTSLPPAMSEGRKLPKAGNAKIEIIKMEKQP